MAEMSASLYPALKSELTNDPRGLGLAAMTDASAAAKLNEVGASAETLADRTTVGAWEAMGAVDGGEWDSRYTAWTVAQRAYYDDLVSGGMFNAASAAVRAKLGSLFSNAQAPISRAALLALQDRPCTRAEKLWGAGIEVKYYDVARARALL